MEFKMVVFDMAGTTVEDSDNVHEALIKGFASEGLIIDRQDANSVMGIPKPVAIRTLLSEKFLLKEHIGEKVSKIHKVFLTEMISFYEKDESVRAKENAEATFSALKAMGVKVCLDTGFSRDIADAIIRRLGWNENSLIDFSVTSDEVINGRPFPDMIFKAMHHFNILSATQVAKVGDTISDLQEGTSAGCGAVIGITTGAFRREELLTVNHTHLVDDLLEVVDIVKASKAG
ncbi:MAG: HAD hydrolase-like protein [Bacteroidetes bacterium]|nr:HAD hydrolase-like protein [Bacteroidota bacterium]